MTSQGEFPISQHKVHDIHITIRHVLTQRSFERKLLIGPKSTEDKGLSEQVIRLQYSVRCGIPSNIDDTHSAKSSSIACQSKASYRVETDDTLCKEFVLQSVWSTRGMEGSGLRSVMKQFA